MNVTAVALLAASAFTGAVLWLIAERRPLRTTTFVMVAAIPVVLLATAALFGLMGEATDGALFELAHPVAVAAAVSTGGLVSTAMLRMADRRGDHTTGTTGVTRHANDNPLADEIAAVSDPRTLRGGATIGTLERIAVSITLLAGWPEGLALILGIKGLGRYPELGRPPASERFIIGTLGSVLWATAAAGVVQTLPS